MLIKQIYASALLMAAVMTGLKIKLTGKRVNGAYIKITLNMLKQFGIKYVQFEENKYNIEKQRFRLEKYQIEPDMSGACYFSLCNSSDRANRRNSFAVSTCSLRLLIPMTIFG